MYQNENNGRGCKVRTKQAKQDWSETSFIKQPHGESCVGCLSNEIHCVLNAVELAKWLTTSFPSSKVVNRWRGTIYKQCVIDVTM
jgi:hypothetical protein